MTTSHNGKKRKYGRKKRNDERVMRKFYGQGGKVKPPLLPWDETRRQRLIRDVTARIQDEKEMLSCTSNVPELANKHAETIKRLEKVLFKLNQPNLDKAIALIDTLPSTSIECNSSGWDRLASEQEWEGRGASDLL